MEDDCCSDENSKIKKKMRFREKWSFLRQIKTCQLPRGEIVWQLLPAYMKIVGINDL